MIYAILIASIVSLTFTSCTEEDVNPKKTELDNGGANGSTGKL
jgi:hypothetical protein